MVIASDFESLSYKSLFLRFGIRFLLFIIGILIASGIMYGIEGNYSTSWHNEEDNTWYNYNTEGLFFLEAFALIISTVTTVGKV